MGELLQLESKINRDNDILLNRDPLPETGHLEYMMMMWNFQFAISLLFCLLFRCGLHLSVL